jgi:hypothetical protein
MGARSTSELVDMPPLAFREATVNRSSGGQVDYLQTLAREWPYT